MQQCAVCNKSYAKLGAHYRYSPGCKVAPVLPSAPEPAPLPAAPSTTPTGDALRWQQASSKLGSMIAHMRLQKNVHILHCEMAVELARAAVLLVLDVLESKLATNKLAAATVVDVRAGATEVLGGLNNITDVCKKQTEGALRPISRPLLAKDEEGKKQFAFFSLIHLIADVLQNDAESRKHTLEESDEIRTGKYRQPPVVLTDTKHGERFRNSPCSRPALPGERRRVVLDLHSWNDDATVGPSPAALSLPTCLLTYADVCCSGSSPSAYAVKSTSTRSCS